MRIGCCTNMISANPDGTGVEFVEKLAQLGFDYIELPLAEMSALSDGAFEELVQRVNKSGIRCETCNNCFPKTIRLTGPGVDDREVDAYVRHALGRANRLGVEYVVFGAGPAKNVPEGFPMEEGYAQVVGLLKRMAPVAKANNITILIEPLRAQECNLINRFEEGCRLAGDVDCEEVKVLVDYYHLVQESEPVEHVAKEGKTWLRHTHFARNEGRSFPSLTDDDDYAPYFQALETAGYDRRISLEAYTGDFDAEAPKALAFFRSWF